MREYAPQSEPGAEAPQPARPPATASMLQLQQMAGNRAVSNLVVQRDSGVQVQAKFPLDYGIPLPAVELENGLKIKPKVTFKGEVGSKFGHSDDKVTVTPVGGKVTRGEGLVPVAKAELEHKFANTTKIKGGLEANPGGLTPSVEFSTPVGIEELSLRVEYAPWKTKYKPNDGTSEISFNALTVGVSRPVEFAGETVYFKGNIEVSAEASIDPIKAFKSLAQKIKGEISAMSAAEIGIAVSLIGGAILVGLDLADSERREKLDQITAGRARKIIAAETVYVSTLEGHTVPASTPVEKLALEQAHAAREKMAARTNMDPDILAYVGEYAPEIYLPFRFRDALLDELIRTTQAELDQYADDHPIRTLWGTRVIEDKRRVQQIVDFLREDGDTPVIRPM